MRFQFRPTVDHAPEPGLGGAEYDVTVTTVFGPPGVPVGHVTSRWDRTNGVHWIADDADGAPVTGASTPVGRPARPKPFERRIDAAKALARKAGFTV